MNRLCLFSLGIVFLSQLVFAQQVLIQVIKDDELGNESKYNYVYYNPPRKTIQVAGKYVTSSSGIRYVHSPSKHKRAAHAAKINAYDYEYGNH